MTKTGNSNVECAFYFTAKDGDNKGLYIWKGSSGHRLTLWNDTKKQNEWEI